MKNDLLHAAGWVLTFAAAAMATAVLSGCGGTPSPAGAVTVYLAAHPVPDRPGMTAGIVLSETITDLGTPQSPRCPARSVGKFGPAVGSPVCSTWDATVETPGGRLLQIRCGSIAARLPCALTYPGAGEPLTGDYAYFLSAGQVASPADIAVITAFAVVPGDNCALTSPRQQVCSLSNGDGSQ